MPIDWQKLRTWNGSQQSAFEELCCQLFSYEKTPNNSKFIRKGAPDAGIECFWKLPSKDEWGLQAKFFLNPPDNNQWQNIDRSIENALDKHPKLTLLIISLPIDRQDPRLENQFWFMNKWDEHVKKWSEWAEKKDMSVEFIYWGKHEIWERLSREEHRGRRYFWFNEEFFSKQWFKDRINENISNVGPRYTPELNIELSIAKCFDSLGRTDIFFNTLKTFYDKIKKRHSKIHLPHNINFNIDLYSQFTHQVNNLLSALESSFKNQNDYINFDKLADLSTLILKYYWEFEEIFEEILKNEKEHETNKKSKKEANSISITERINNIQHHLREFRTQIHEFEHFLQSHEAELANIPAMLLIGNAGTGKTHLFCDIANQRINQGLPTILLLGNHFDNFEPWHQITNFLGLNCAREEFLGALESSAQAIGAKSLILIDALNEGEGKYIWHKYLAGILATLNRYPWISIAISVRSSYESITIPDGLISKKIIRVVHYGFAEHEYQATKTFFDYYGIERPSIPLLIPEFQNPLFLKLFCIGLREQALTKIPSGINGISTIFNIFIEAINKKLARPEYLNYDSKSQLIQRAINKLASLMANQNERWLTREDAQKVLNEIFPTHDFEKSLFRCMVDEGLLIEDRFRISKGEWFEGIHFNYERFTDHFIAKILLDKHLDLSNYSNSFKTNRSLGSIFKDEWEARKNQGIIEAFSILLPERIDQELIGLLHEKSISKPLIEAFIDSFIWRSRKAFNSSTIDLINKYVIKYHDMDYKFLDTLLTVASDPSHPFNANFLHRYLMKFSLADRDGWWTVFLHDQYQNHTAIERLIDWVWTCENKSEISNDSIKLCGIALIWFLTSSNRSLRDRATKALVSLFWERIDLLNEIIPNFLNVNDPYVLERLYTAAYGCALRSKNNNHLVNLALNIYEWFFVQSDPYPHLLMRDYARGVIEVALFREIDLNIDRNKIKPPYNSDWIFEIPSLKELEKYKKWNKDMPDEECARTVLYDSVLGFGDFARYIIGTNHGLFAWTSKQFKEGKIKTKKEFYSEFLYSLTLKQKDAFQNYEKMFKEYHTINWSNIIQRDIKKEKIVKDIEEKYKRQLDKTEKMFRKTLGKSKEKTFEEHVMPYINDSTIDQHELNFDLCIAQRWIFQKVLDWGWTVERFGNFDRRLIRYSNYGRESNKPERIGKKYQWIAYYEFLARVADNFYFKGDFWYDEIREYDGPWQIIRRDIDPSCLLQKTYRQDWEPIKNTWWFPINYKSWYEIKDPRDWIKSIKDLPSIEKLIEIKDENEISWYNLESYLRWIEPPPLGEDKFEIPRREIWYMLKSYIVQKKDIDELYLWGIKQNFFGRWMPESHELDDVFIGEYYWSPAYHYFNPNTDDNYGWIYDYNKKLPKKVMVATEQYSWARGSYDCSIEDTIRFYLPCKLIINKMKLEWNGDEGHLYDKHHNLIAFDPSIKNTGPSALLINKELFIEFLKDHGYEILWTILGEKRILGGRDDSDKLLGLSEISGCYRILDGKVNGIISSNFIHR